MIRFAIALAGALSCAMPAPLHAQEPVNDYPTDVRAEYVFGCMESNGRTRDVLSKCACSIDVIASILPYEKYVEAETILAVGITGGERTAMMRSDPVLQEKVAEMRRAQAEADVRCF